MLKELLSANVDLYVDQGDTYYKTFTLKDNTASIINLTGMSVAVDVRRYANTRRTYPMVVNVLDAVAGTIELSLTAAQSNLYTNDRYVYQVRLIDGTDIVKIMSGQILVEAGASSLNTDLQISGNTGSGNTGAI